MIHRGESGEVRRRGRAWPDAADGGKPALSRSCLSEVEPNVTGYQRASVGTLSVATQCSRPTQQNELISYPLERGLTLCLPHGTEEKTDSLGIALAP